MITESARKAHKKHLAKREANGICKSCNRPAAPGRKFCEYHLTKAKENAKARYAERRARGVCLGCGKDMGDNPHVRCDECNAKFGKPEKRRERSAERRRERKANGLCVVCGQPARDGQTLCDVHADNNLRRTKELVEQRKNLGVCRYCGAQLPDGKRMCLDCRKRTLENRRRNKFGGNWQPAMDRDNHQCQICGRADALDVHHIDGRGEGSPTPNHALDNLIVLCSGCHSSITKFRSTQRNKDLAVRLILA